MFLTLLPYLYGYTLANGRRFMWLAYNYDDSCVYLSWMRQAADGSLRSFDLFTTNPQHGMALNPLFLVLGNIARFTRLPLLAVYHLSRLAFGFALLLIVWQLIRATVRDRLARRLAFLFVCVSSGLGWLPFWWSSTPGALAINSTPVDVWQPEAITFLSLYLSPLFCFSLALQAGILLLLFRGERTGRFSYTIWAGLLGLTLALVHTYDVLSLAAVWLLYRIVTSALELKDGSKLRTQPWLHAVLAGVITIPGVAYVAFQLHSETVFRQRANVETLSPPPAYIIAGYGLTFLLAIIACFALYREGRASVSNEVTDQHSRPPMPGRGEASSPSLASREMKRGRDEQSRPPLPSEERAVKGEGIRGEGRELDDQDLPDTDIANGWLTSKAAATFLISWAFANFAVAYLPNSFQRKLLQGEHFPIAILAGVGASWLLLHPRLRLPPRYRLVAGVLLALFLSLTNIRFVLRDTDYYGQDIVQTGMHRPYLRPGEIAALDWIDQHVPRNLAVQPLPYLKLYHQNDRTQFGPTDMSLACLTPGLTDHHVYCGHWGETPDYRGKLQELVHFTLPVTTDVQRQALLRKMNVHYLIYSQKVQPDEDADRLAPMFRGLILPPSYLHLVYSNPDADIYRIDETVLNAK